MGLYLIKKDPVVLELKLSFCESLNVSGIMANEDLI